MKAKKAKAPAAGTKLAHHLRLLATLSSTAEFDALKCTTAADALDRSARVLGVSGARVKTLGAYIHAKSVYARVAGKPYAE